MKKKSKTFVGKFMWMLDGKFVEVISENSKSVSLVNGRKILKTQMNVQARTGMLLELGEWKNM